MQKKDLLEEFILDKLAHYEEPQKRGRTGRRSVGLSRQKYTASLLALTNCKQKVIAKDIGVSFGVLRNWFSDEPFQECVNKNRREFAELFVDHIKKRTEEYKGAYNQLLDIPADTNAALPHLGFDEYVGASYYSQDLWAAILNAVVQELNSMNDDPSRQFEKWLFAIEAYGNCAILHPGLRISAEATLNTLKTRLMSSVFNDLKKILSKRRITDREKRLALVCIYQLEAALLK